MAGQFFCLKRIKKPQMLFSNMRKSNTVLLALGTFLGVVGRKRRPIVNNGLCTGYNSVSHNKIALFEKLL